MEGRALFKMQFQFIYWHILQINGIVIRLHGEAGHAIVQLANEEVADLIVVGCRGKGSIRRTFTGSVTDFIVHHAEVPVIVARHKDHINHHHHFHLNLFHTDHGSPKGSPKGSPSLHRKIHV